MIVETLKEMVDSRAAYSTAHLVKTLFLISKCPIGRFQIMKETGLGEATVKTILNRLEEKKFISSTAEGHRFTNEGKKFFDKIKSRISEPVKIPSGSYTVAEYNSAILVKGAKEKINLGIEQRDEAIKIGAQGATTLICEEGRLYFPGTAKNIFEFESLINEYLNYKDNDVIIIGSASTYQKAEEAAISIALSILG